MLNNINMEKITCLGFFLIFLALGLGENIQNFFDAVSKNEMRRIGIYHQILEQKAGDAQQTFNILKNQLRITKQIDRKIEKAFKREASTDSTDKPVNNVEDLIYNMLKKEEIPGSHAYNAGLNKAAERLVPMTNSLEKKLASLQKTIELLEKDLVSRMECFTCVEKTCQQLKQCNVLELALGVQQELEETENKFWNSTDNPVNNIEDLIYNMLKKEEILGSHAYNAGLNKAAERLGPMTNSLEKKLASLQKTIELLEKDLVSRMECFTCVEKTCQQEECNVLELALGVSQELEEIENEFWTMLNFPNTEDRQWKWIMSLLLLNTPEAKMWRNLLEENKVSIAMFARCVVVHCGPLSKIYDSSSKRVHQDVYLVPRKCTSIEALYNLMKNGNFECLSVEQRIVVIMVVQMKAKRENRKNWPIDKSIKTETNKIANSNNFRCVLLKQVKFVNDLKSATLPPIKKPVDEQDRMSVTCRKPITFFPRVLPYQNIRNYFPSKIAQKSTEFMCELKDTYNTQKPTGTILIRFSTVEIAAAAILTRQIPYMVELEMVKCDEYEDKCSENQVHIDEYKNVKLSTLTHDGQTTPMVPHKKK